MESTCLEYGGQLYKTVKIGNQIWMAENLNYKTEGSNCYGEDSCNGEKYGRLYNWETAMNVCPRGWHLPSNKDWETLASYAGSFLTLGTMLKANNGWQSCGNGTDNHGFSAMPGGYGFSDGSFGHVGSYGYWWSSTEVKSVKFYSCINAYAYIMYYLISDVYKGNIYKHDMLSVRCVKD